MYYKIAQLILTPKQKTDTASEVFVAQPNADKEALAGKLFMIIEVKSRKSDGLKIINFLINNLNNNYYNNEKIILREKISTLKIEHIFEFAIAKTNKDLFEFLKTEKIKLNRKSISAIAGVIYKNDLHFTNIGENNALLIYKNKNKNNEIKYQLINITKQSENKNTKKSLNLTKLFTDVISGAIPRNGYFVITNEILPEYISNKQFIDIITKLPPAGAVEQIKNILSKINIYVSFSIIIIKNTIGAAAPKTAQRILDYSNQSPVNSLNITENTTEKFLTPSGIVKPKKWLDNLIRSANSVNFLAIFKKISKIIKNITFYLIDFIIFIFKKVKKDNNGKNIFNRPAKIEFKQKLKNILHQPIKWFKKLNKKNKILIIAVIICAALLIQNLFILNLNNKKIEKEKNYINLINFIKQKQNQTNASLLYGNRIAAKNFLEEMSELLSQLPQITEFQIAQFNELTAQHTRQINEIRHVDKIESPSELANLSNLDINAKPINLTLINQGGQNIIYIGDTNQKSIYSLNLTDNLITNIINLELPIKQLNYPAQNTDNIYYFNLDSIIKLDSKTQEMSNLIIQFIGQQRNIIDMAIYNNKLYLLDKQNNQIYRYSIGQDNLINGQPWIKEKNNLANAQCISIDGHIYVLSNDGALFKYLKGKKEDFKLAEIDPKLEQPNKLIVSPDKYIYILEPINKRLAVFNKTGKFLLQYQSDQFTDLKDFTVDEKNKKIYFLNKTSVYEVNGTHFEK